MAPCGLAAKYNNHVKMGNVSSAELIPKSATFFYGILFNVSDLLKFELELWI